METLDSHAHLYLRWIEFSLKSLTETITLVGILTNSSITLWLENLSFLYQVTQEFPQTLGPQGVGVFPSNLYYAPQITLSPTGHTQSGASNSSYPTHCIQ